MGLSAATASRQGGVPERDYLIPVPTTTGRVVTNKRQNDPDPFMFSFRREISQRLRALREEKGGSRTDLARKVEVTDGAIAQWENDAVPWERVSQLAEALAVSPRFLLTGNRSFDELSAVLAEIEAAARRAREIGPEEESGS